MRDARGRLAVALLAATAAGCSGAQVAGDQALRPIEERRARAVIEEALLDNGMKPAPPRQHTLGDGTQIEEDMAIDGEPYAVAYVTTAEEKALGASVPRQANENDPLALVKAEDTIVLLLFEKNYRYDAGGDHTVTIVTAERRLKRDVTDFVTHVVRQHKEP
jgi:hypothetical protein